MTVINLFNLRSLSLAIPKVPLWKGYWPAIVSSNPPIGPGSWFFN